MPSQLQFLNNFASSRVGTQSTEFLVNVTGSEYAILICGQAEFFISEVMGSKN